MPKVQIRRRFKPFIKDELSLIIKDSRALVSHPEAESKCPYTVDFPVTLALGPEGGFIRHEIDALQDTGFKAVSLSNRIFNPDCAVENVARFENPKRNTKLEQF